MSNTKVLPLLEPEVSDVVVPCCPPLTERPLTADEAEKTARMFKALGDPVRLRLFSSVARTRAARHVSATSPTSAYPSRPSPTT